MSKKVIKLAHHVCDYECMWNGIEDLYHEKSGEKVPDSFFFSLSGIGNFVYLKFNKGILKRQAAWNDGRTKQMYKCVSDIIGFNYKHIEGRKFFYAMKKIKEQIDIDKPVVLGCLDMYYLSYYPKFYYKEHIPIHYVMMIGYDDAKECAYILDCGVEEIQEITYELLEKALNIEKNTLSDKNAFCIIDFHENIKSIIEIAKEGFEKKAEKMLNPPVGFIGIKGMRKLASEINQWPFELSSAEYEEALKSIAMFTGTVPVLPSRLKENEVEEIKHMAAREKLSQVLDNLGKEYGIEEWIMAADLFLESGKMLEQMTKQITDYLVKERTELTELSNEILSIADIEEKAFKYMLVGSRKENIKYGKSRLQKSI